VTEQQRNQVKTEPVGNSPERSAQAGASSGDRHAQGDAPEVLRADRANPSADAVPPGKPDGEVDTRR
jgi:hypothetical protein